METQRKSFKSRMITMMIGVVCMGIFLSFILMVNYGTDTCTFMNNNISLRTGLSLGTTMVLTNLIYFIPEVIWGRQYIGWGSIANMTLIGYICDFCRFLERRYLPEKIFTDMPYRPLVFAAALLCFLVAAAIYMNADAGLAPFDSIPMIVRDKTGWSYTIVRIAWDFFTIVVGILAGGHLTIATVILALTVGPMVTFIGKKLK